MRSVYYRLILAFFKFIPGNKLFNFLRARLPNNTVNKLDSLLRLRCKIAKQTVTLEFITQCQLSNIYPRNYYKVLRNNRLKPTSENLYRLAESYLQTIRDDILKLKSAHLQLLSVMNELNMYCQIKFYNHAKTLLTKVRAEHRRKLDLSLTNGDTISSFPPNLDEFVLNLSDTDLNKIQMEALSVGLKFAIPPSHLRTY